MIHCGVSSFARNITLEACAYNYGFCRPDVDGKCLVGNFAKPINNGIGKKMLLTKLDVDRMAKELNGVETNDDCECRPPSSDTKSSEKFITSSDVGSYLCGYSYLKSLDFNLDRSLFIHVPEINKPLSSEETSNGILSVIKKCLDQLNEKNL